MKETISKSELKKAFEDFGIKKDIIEDFLDYVFPNNKIKLKEQKKNDN